MANDTYDNEKIVFHLIQMHDTFIKNDGSKTKDEFLKYYSTASENLYSQELEEYTNVSIRQIMKEYNNHSESGYIVVVVKMLLPRAFSTIKAYKYVRNYLVDSNLFSQDCLLYEALASIMIEEYESYDDEGKRIALCFLQRYMFNTKEKTDEFLRGYGIEPPEEYAGLKKLIKMKFKDTNM